MRQAYRTRGMIGPQGILQVYEVTIHATRAAHEFHKISRPADNSRRTFLQRCNSHISGNHRSSTGLIQPMTTTTAFPTTSAAWCAATITPSDAARRVQAGEATIIDVREPDEHRRQHVPNTLLQPSSSFRVASFPESPANQQLLILCRSGGRASQVATELRNAGRTNVSVIDGGIVAWERAGLPTVTDSKAPLPIMRQVMVTVGVLLIACSALAATVSPWFLVGTGFIGAGLLTAGATGMCMLSTILMKMPWNRATNGASAANCCSR